jgi:pyridoxamine 5'-phosphate oxidase
MNLQDYRQNYNKGFIDEKNVHPNPIEQFRVWFNQADENEIIEPNAVVLSTSVNNEVSSRTVLLKEFSDKGFVFFTNYNSNKGQQLIQNPHCSLLFLWLPMERQIIITGQAEQIPREQSEAYFMSRPRESQLSAWASQQSEAVNNREDLDKLYLEVEKRFENEPIYCPTHWGGFIVKPISVEFWQGRSGRLHDRLKYSKNSEEWLIQRLQP